MRQPPGNEAAPFVSLAIREDGSERDSYSTGKRIPVPTSSVWTAGGQLDMSSSLSSAGSWLPSEDEEKHGGKSANAASAGAGRGAGKRAPPALNMIATSSTETLRPGRPSSSASNQGAGKSLAMVSELVNAATPTKARRRTPAGKDTPAAVQAELCSICQQHTTDAAWLVECDQCQGR